MNAWVNQRRQLYLLAFAAYTTSLVVMAALAWLAIQYNTVAGVVQLTIALSGNGLGGFALVLGLLRDDRAERERQRADEMAETAKNAVEAAKKSEQKANEAQQLIDQLQQQLQHQAQQQAEESQKLVQEFQAQVETERQQAEQERQQAEHVRRQAEQERQQAEQERQRANRAEAELQRLRDDQRHEARLRRLEEALGLPSETATAVDPPGENQ